MQEKEKIAIRKLVDFILRKGSIDSRHKSEHTAFEGAKLHRKLQQLAGSDYQKEVKLSIEIMLNQQIYIIEGRADGIYRNEKQQVVIDEIKTSEPAFSDLLPEQVEMFWYQVMCYGYIYCQKEELEEVVLQLTYYQTTTEEITKVEKRFSQTDLALFFEDVTQKYEQWLIFQKNWREIRNQSLQKLEFPYGEYRNGQRELAIAVYKTILSEQKLFVEAPTGTGKTISTLFPALKAVGEAKAERIFYLTAKTITRQVVEDAVAAMNQKKLQLKSVTLTAKDKICFLTERNCTPQHCLFANGYYDRLNEGLWDILNNENQLTREVIEAYAQKHQLCPFELSLDVSLWCDLVICDYNYIFDPTVYLRRFFEENQPKKENIFLVDEVHNLVNRSREMYSASLSQNQFQAIKKIIGANKTALGRSFSKLNQEFKKLEEFCQAENKAFVHQRAAIDTFMNIAYQTAERFNEWLAENQDFSDLNQVLDFYFNLLHYLDIGENYDDHYVTYVNVANQDVIIKQFCIDPSYLLKVKLDKAKASILFSASLTPLDYYQEILGGGETSLRYRIASPFPLDNQQLIIGSHLKTTYKERENSIELIIDCLSRMVQQKTGNYFVFFPSYSYMDRVYEGFIEKNSQVTTVIQDSHMDEDEREAFLSKFVVNPEKTLVGFCVLGGIFSEGIDLKGTRLIGVAIIGVGLPQINHEQEMIKEYYQREKLQGFQFAYQIPGMNKVLQAAGRVIRDVSDRGVVLLLDQRFSSPDYQKLFPPHWKKYLITRSNRQLTLNIQEFWQNSSDNRGNMEEKK